MKKKAINEAGSAENIKLWCYPTPQQRQIFNGKKLVLLGPWGSGKTMVDNFFFAYKYAFVRQSVRCRCKRNSVPL